MAAHDDVDPGIREHLCPVALAVIRRGHVLLAPVGARHHELRPCLACGRHVRRDGPLVHHAHGPGLRQRNAVGHGGVAQNGNDVSLALDDGRHVGRLLTVRDTRHQHLRMRRAPVGELRRDAVHTAVERMVVGVGDDVESRGDLRVPHFLRAVEGRVAGESQRRAAQRALLAGHGHVSGSYVICHLRKEVRIVARAVRHEARVLHRVVQQDVPHHQNLQLDGRRSGLDGLPSPGRLVVDRDVLAPGLRFGHRCGGAARKRPQPRKGGGREERAAREYDACHGDLLAGGERGPIVARSSRRAARSSRPAARRPLALRPQTMQVVSLKTP